MKEEMKVLLYVIVYLLISAIVGAIFFSIKISPTLPTEGSIAIETYLLCGVAGLLWPAFILVIVVEGPFWLVGWLAIFLVRLF